MVRVARARESMQGCSKGRASCIPAGCLTWEPVRVGRVMEMDLVHHPQAVLIKCGHYALCDYHSSLDKVV